MSRGLAKLLQVVNIVAMVILMLVFMDYKVITYIIVAIACGVAILLSYFLRCPHCGAWPRKGSMFDEYCPRCGGNLND